MIAGLLGWTGLPQWALELLAIALVAGGAVTAFWIYHHHVYVEGIHAQQIADRRASAKVVAEARAETKAAQAAATAAHAAYLSEITHENALAAAQPLPAVRLCLNPYAGRPGVPEASAPLTGAGSARTTAGNLPGVPARDPALRPREGPDIAPLLALLARQGDRQVAINREWHGRTPH